MTYDPSSPEVKGIPTIQIGSHEGDPTTLLHLSPDEIQKQPAVDGVSGHFIGMRDTLSGRSGLDKYFVRTTGNETWDTINDVQRHKHTRITAEEVTHDPMKAGWFHNTLLEGSVVYLHKPGLNHGSLGRTVRYRIITLPDEVRGSVRCVEVTDVSNVDPQGNSGRNQTYVSQWRYAIPGLESAEPVDRSQAAIEGIDKRYEQFSKGKINPTSEQVREVEMNVPYWNRSSMFATTVRKTVGGFSDGTYPDLERNSFTLPDEAMDRLVVQYGGQRFMVTRQQNGNLAVANTTMLAAFREATEKRGTAWLSGTEQFKIERHVRSLECPSRYEADDSAVSILPDGPIVMKNEDFGAGFTIAEKDGKITVEPNGDSRKNSLVVEFQMPQSRSDWAHRRSQQEIPYHIDASARMDFLWPIGKIGRGLLTDEERNLRDAAIKVSRRGSYNPETYALDGIKAYYDAKAAVAARSRQDAEAAYKDTQRPLHIRAKQLASKAAKVAVKIVQSR